MNAAPKEHKMLELTGTMSLGIAYAGFRSRGKIDNFQFAENTLSRRVKS